MAVSLPDDVLQESCISSWSVRGRSTSIELVRLSIGRMEPENVPPGEQSLQTQC